MTSFFRFRLLQEARLLHVAGVEQPDHKDNLAEEIKKTEGPNPEDQDANRKERNEKRDQKESDESKESADPTEMAKRKRSEWIGVADKDAAKEKQASEKAAHDVMELQQKLAREQQEKVERNKNTDDVMNVVKDGLTAGAAPDVHTDVAQADPNAAATAAVDKTATGQAQQAKAAVETKAKAQAATVQEKNAKQQTV